MRVGVGRPNSGIALAEFVLGAFTKAEQKEVDQVTDKAIDDLLSSMFTSSAESKEQSLGG